MIAILMATYNGQKYLKSQIESIISQTYKDWCLYVRDDGSTDKTLNIISEYCNLYTNKIFLFKDSTIHRGAAHSFMWLLEHVNADYYMFSDQDDIWLPNKIQYSLDKMSALECNNPQKAIIVHSDLKVVNSELKEISSSFWDYTHLRNIIDMPNLFYTNNAVTGCTMLINNKCKKVSIPYKNILMHDAWIALKAFHSNGIIYPLNTSEILYRQHSSNVLGTKGYRNTLIYRFSNIWKSLQNNKKIYIMANEISDMSIFKFLYMKWICYRKMTTKP